MANYYRVSPKFWLWARRRGLTDAQTSLAFFLLTCSHRNLEGLYRLPKQYVMADLAWTAEKVEENLEVVLGTGFAVYDEDAEMVLIPKALKHQAPTTPLQIKGAISQLERIPRTSLWNGFRMACRSHCPRLADAVDERWPSDADAIYAHARGGSSSSSSSNSKNTPQPPEQARGAQDEQNQAAPGKGNPRALGTNPRAVAAAERLATAVGALTSPTDQDRAGWERLQAAMQAAVGEGSAWPLYVEPLTLAGVAGGQLVIDGPTSARAWVRAPMLITKCAESVGVPARMATATEHAGLEQVAA